MRSTNCPLLLDQALEDGRSRVDQRRGPGIFYATTISEGARAGRFPIYKRTYLNSDVEGSGDTNSSPKIVTWRYLFCFSLHRSVTKDDPERPTCVDLRGVVSRDPPRGRDFRRVWVERVSVGIAGRERYAGLTGGTAFGGHPLRGRSTVGVLI